MFGVLTNLSACLQGPPPALSLTLSLAFGPAAMQQGVKERMCHIPGAHSKVALSLSVFPGTSCFASERSAQHDCSEYYSFPACSHRALTGGRSHTRRTWVKWGLLSPRFVSPNNYGNCCAHKKHRGNVQYFSFLVGSGRWWVWLIKAPKQTHWCLWWMVICTNSSIRSMILPCLTLTSKNDSLVFG